MIRRAIALQEKVDAIAASDQTVDSETHTETSDPSSELIDGSRSEAVDGIQELSVDCDSAADETLEIKDSICEYSANGALETAPDPAVVSDDCNVDGALQLQNPVEHVIDSGDSKVMSESTLDCCVDSADESKEEMDVTEIGVDSEINANKDVSTPKETVEDPDDSKALPRSSPTAVTTLFMKSRRTSMLLKLLMKLKRIWMLQKLEWILKSTQTKKLRLRKKLLKIPVQIRV